MSRFNISIETLLTATHTTGFRTLVHLIISLCHSHKTKFEEIWRQKKISFVGRKFRNAQKGRETFSLRARKEGKPSSVIIANTRQSVPQLKYDVTSSHSSEPRVSHISELKSTVWGYFCVHKGRNWHRNNRPTVLHKPNAHRL
jgi:hypothetical protein